MKYLVGFGDTEGCPHVLSNDSELWDVTVLFRYIMNDIAIENDDIFHILHLTIPKMTEKKYIKKALKTHFSSIEYLKELYGCDHARIGFWGANHDIAVLNSYVNDHPFESIDLLSEARTSLPGMESYNVGNLCKHFEINSKQKIHTSLGDTVRLELLVPHLKLDLHKLVTKHEQQKTNGIPRRITKAAADESIARAAILFARKLKL